MNKDHIFGSDTVVSIIMVINNETDVFVKKIGEIKQTLSDLKIAFEILIIANGSGDETINIISSQPKTMKHVRIIILSKKYSNEIALTAGLDNCVGDYAVLFNLHTDPIKKIPEILSRLIKNKKDILTGSPEIELTKYDWFSKIFLYLVRKFSSRGFNHQSNHLTVLNRKAINSIMRTRRKSRDFSYISSFIGLKHETFEYLPVISNNFKKERQNFLKTILSTIDIIISHSYKPIRLLSFAGMMLSIFYLTWVCLVIILFVFFNFKNIVPQGWISVSTMISVLFFILFSLMTLMSEYLIRILSESRNEPFYFISEEINKSTLIPRKKTLNIV